MSSCTCTTCGASFALEELRERDANCARCAPATAILRWGSFELEARLGRGGMGEVWRARDASGRIVALKILRAELGAASARFEREARAAQRIAHPGVARVLDSGVFEGRPFLVQELFEGRTLRRALGESTWPIGAALRCAAEIADALAAAHAVDIVHRDVKPENVLLDGAGHPHLLDFGVARASEEASLTKTGELVGTPQYMAPEQVLEEPEAIGPATDLHALGLLLYEMLTGRSPFAGRNLLQTLRFVEALEPEPPSRHRAAIPAGVDELVLALLAKEPKSRPQTANGVAARLRALAGEPAGSGGRRSAVAFGAWLVLACTGGAAIASALWAMLGSRAEPSLSSREIERREDVEIKSADRLRAAVRAASEPSQGGTLELSALLQGADGESARTWLLARGTAELRLGQFSAARASLQAVVDAGCSEAQGDLAFASFGLEGLLPYVASGDREALLLAARTHLREADPPDAPSDRELANVVRTALEGEMPRAREALAALVARDPDHVPSALLATWWLGPRAERSTALEALALRFDWRSPERHFTRAGAALAASQWQLAHDALRLARAAGHPRERCERVLHAAFREHAALSASFAIRGGFAP